MVNLAVKYRRIDQALITLRDEVYATYGYTPKRPSEGVTGYQSSDNFTGHNADINGVVHALDIFTDEYGNLPEAQGRELANKIVAELERRGIESAYVIHDMSPGAPWPAIAGYFNGWQWQDYHGVSPHSDHIHVSIGDLYWGDYPPVGPEIYDSTESWNLGTPFVQEEEVTEEQIEAVANKAADKVLNAQFERKGTNLKGTISLATIIQWFDANMQFVVNQTVDAIKQVPGVSLPEDIAEQVAQKFAERLQS